MLYIALRIDINVLQVTGHPMKGKVLSLLLYTWTLLHAMAQKTSSLTVPITPTPVKMCIMKIYG